MWLEIKACITIIACFIFAIIVGLANNLVFSLLCIMGISTMLFGDMLMGYKIVKTDAIHKLDPCDTNEKIIELHLLGGGVRLLKAKKAPLGKWEFIFNKKKVSVLDDGGYPFSYPNGNKAILAHESFDRNINLFIAKYLEEAFKEHKVNNTHDLYKALKAQEVKNAN
jgi:hypothetical protein